MSDMDALVAAIRAATDDYRRTFPEPYSLSPNLKLAVDLAAALEAIGLPALLERVEAATAARTEFVAMVAEHDALAAKVADAWDEGSTARGEALQKWYDPMYWPDVPNPYRTAPTEGTEG